MVFLEWIICENLRLGSFELCYLIEEVFMQNYSLDDVIFGSELEFKSLRWRISRMKSQKCVLRLPKFKNFTQKLFITVEKPLNLILNTEKPQVGLRKSLNRVLNAKNCCRPPSKSQNSLNLCIEAQKQLNGKPFHPKNLKNRFTILSHN